MSRYELGKLMFDVTRFPRLQEEFERDSNGVLQRYDLTAEEKDALLNKDVHYMYDAGVHPLLLMMGSRLMGIDMREYLGVISGKSPQGLALPNEN